MYIALARTSACNWNIFEPSIADLHANSYALFKAKDKKLLDDSELDSRLQTAEQINNEYVQFFPSHVKTTRPTRTDGLTNS